MRPYPEAQDRVATLAQTFGIKEFQFYDWFATYSKPTNGPSWPDPFKSERQIHLETIRAYIDEIHRRGGRAWACVQGVGAGTDVIGLFSNNVVSFSRNVVLRGPLFSLNLVWK